MLELIGACLSLQDASPEAAPVPTSSTCQSTRADRTNLAVTDLLWHSEILCANLEELHEKLTEALLACEGHHDADH